MTDALAEAVAAGLTIVDLGRPLFNGMPQSPNHPRFWHSYPRRHGDMVREGGDSGSNDWISLGTHVGTHIDALSHVSHEGRMFGDVSVEDSMIGGRLTELTVDQIPPIVTRGVLIDVAKAHGKAELDAGYEITRADLEVALKAQGTTLHANDVVVVRSGWGRRFTSDPASYAGAETGVPGIGAESAAWLAEHAPIAVGADTIALERLEPGRGHASLPAHHILLVENGIYIIETLDLEELSALGVYEFTLIVVPLRILGGTGSPVRPLAVISR